MGITSARLKTLGLIDKIVTEPVGGAHRNPQQMMVSLKKALADALKPLQDKTIDQLLEARYERLMAYGKFKEVDVA